MFDEITKTFTAFTEVGPALASRAIRELSQGVMPERKPFDYDSFPEDLGAEYMQHYILMRFNVSKSTFGNPTGANYGSLSSTGFTDNQYNVALFTPSENGGGVFPTFDDIHEYADISMTNVLLNQIAAGKATPAIKGAAALTGRALNPGVQVLYKTTQLRTFDFAFLMTPRSEKESITMKNIIKKIRGYAAPEDGTTFYRSPAEVEIQFRLKQGENPHIIKLKKQVITGINVQYSPGTFSTFTNGHPVSALLTLRTREMEIINREDIMASGSKGGY